MAGLCSKLSSVCSFVCNWKITERDNEKFSNMDNHSSPEDDYSSPEDNYCFVEDSDGERDFCEVIQYYCTTDTPIMQLDCEAAFNELTEKEKHYAHFLSKALWFGSLINFLQDSFETPLIFLLIYKLFHHDSVSELKQVALDKCGFTEDNYTWN